MKNNRLVMLTIGLLMGWILNAGAGLILEETFNTYSGGLNGETNNASYYNGAWTAGPSWDVSGGVATLAGGTTGASRLLATPFSVSGSSPSHSAVYVSTTIKLNNVAGAGFYFALMNSADETLGRMQINTTNAQVMNTSSGGSGTTSVTNDAFVRLVYKWEDSGGSSKLTFWVNPTDETDTPAYNSTRAYISSDVDAVKVEFGAWGITSPEYGAVSELLIGTTFEDVVTVPDVPPVVGLILEETFNTYSGGLNGETNNASYYNGAWTAGPSWDVAGGVATLAGGTTGASRLLATPFSVSGSPPSYSAVYVSATMKLNNVAGAGFAFALLNSADERLSRVQINTTNAQIINTSSGGSGTTAITNDAFVRLVYKWEDSGGSSKVTFWVNPTDETDTPAYTSTRAYISADVDAAKVEFGAWGISSSEYGAVSELLIGTTFDDVMALPELPPTANGVSIQWMNDNGVFSGYNIAELTDLDEDGLLMWEEYYAGTDPNSAASVFVVSLSGSELNWIASTNSGVTLPFDIYRSVDLLADWIQVATNVARSTTGTTVWTDPNPPGDVSSVFYKAVIQLP